MAMTTDPPTPMKYIIVFPCMKLLFHLEYLKHENHFEQVNYNLNQKITYESNRD